MELNQNYYAKACLEEVHTKGISISKYAKANKLSCRALYVWISKIKDQETETGFVKLQEKPISLQDSLKATYKNVQIEIPESCLELFLQAVTNINE